MPFLLTLTLPMQVAHEIIKNKRREELLRGGSKSALGFVQSSGCDWVIDGSVGLDKQVAGNNLQKMFLYPQSLSSRITVSNAVVKRNLHLDRQLDAGKAANLFSASRRFRVFASLAVTHNVIVSLLLNLQSGCIGLVYLGKAGMFTELAALDSFS